MHICVGMDYVFTYKHERLEDDSENTLKDQGLDDMSIFSLWKRY